MAELNKYSKTLTQDVTQPAAQAMYYAIGFKEEDFAKAQVGIASMGWDGNPCNMHLLDLGTAARTGVQELMVTTNVSDPDERLRSFELVAEVAATAPT